MQEITITEFKKICKLTMNPFAKKNCLNIYSVDWGLFAVEIEKLNTNNVSANIPVWMRNWLISAGLEPVLSHTKKSCIASYYRYIATNIKIKIIKLIPVLLAHAFG